MFYQFLRRAIINLSPPIIGQYHVLAYAARSWNTLCIPTSYTIFKDITFYVKSMQHGFRSGRSCEIQLLNTIDDLAKNLNDRKQTDVILLDFSKAFNKAHTIVFVLNFHIMAFVVSPYFGLKIFLLGDHNKSL